MKLPRTTEARVIEMARGLHHEQCCGMSEFSGMWRVKSASDAVAVRKATYASGQRGVVIATIVNHHSDCPPSCYKTNPATGYFRKAGFSPVRRFKSPRTGSDITVWMADSIRNETTIPADIIVQQGIYQQLVPAVAGED